MWAWGTIAINLLGPRGWLLINEVTLPRDQYHTNLSFMEIARVKSRQDNFTSRPVTAVHLSLPLCVGSTECPPYALVNDTERRYNVFNVSTYCMCTEASERDRHWHTAMLPACHHGVKRNCKRTEQNHPFWEGLVIILDQLLFLIIFNNMSNVIKE